MKPIPHFHPAERGFSMIELMVVVALIGILCSFAIPAYKDYVIKAKVIELFTVAQPTKLAVTAALISGIPAEEINNQSLGLGTIENIGRVQAITVDSGIITITGNSKALEIPDDKTFALALTPKAQNGTIAWECSASPAELKKYAPSHCTSPIE